MFVCVLLTFVACVTAGKAKREGSKKAREFLPGSCSVYHTCVVHWALHIQAQYMWCVMMYIRVTRVEGPKIAVLASRAVWCGLSPSAGGAHLFQIIL